MRTTLAKFSSSLNRIRDIADDIDANAFPALADPAIRGRHETVQCAATVALSGFFESFLRQIAEKFIDQLNGVNRPFILLPQRLRHTHFERGGAALSRRTQDDRANRTSRISATSDDIAMRLASVVLGTPYQVVWEGFADTQSNPGPEAVSEFLKRFGIRDPWNEIASKTTRSAGTLKLELQSFMSLRHECAHSGIAITIPLPSDIRQFCDMLDLIGSAIVQVLEDYLATI